MPESVSRAHEVVVAHRCNHLIKVRLSATLGSGYMTCGRRRRRRLFSFFDVVVVVVAVAVVHGSRRCRSLPYGRSRS